MACIVANARACADRTCRQSARLCSIARAVANRTATMSARVVTNARAVANWSGHGAARLVAIARAYANKTEVLGAVIARSIANARSVTNLRRINARTRIGAYAFGCRCRGRCRRYSIDLRRFDVVCVLNTGCIGRKHKRNNRESNPCQDRYNHRAKGHPCMCRHAMSLALLQNLVR